LIYPAGKLNPKEKRKNSLELEMEKKRENRSVKYFVPEGF
jgi:hypothetical protein